MGNSKQSFIKTTSLSETMRSFILNSPPVSCPRRTPIPSGYQCHPIGQHSTDGGMDSCTEPIRERLVVQWTSVPYSEPTSLHWEHISETARSFIVTGLKKPLLSIEKSFFVLLVSMTGPVVWIHIIEKFTVNHAINIYIVFFVFFMFK